MDLTSEQRMTILAAFLGWMLDAFDFFLLTFLLKDIAKEFGVDVPAVAYALFLTLAMRFVGAFIFGRLGRPVGTQAGADAGYPLLFDPRRARRFLAEPHDLSYPARAVRRRHGRRMGSRQLACDGIHSAASAGAGVRHSAMRLPDRLPARRNRLWPALWPNVRRLYDRLAGDVPAQRPARFPRAVHPQRRSGIAGLRGVEGACEAPIVGDDHQPTADWSSTWSC